MLSVFTVTNTADSGEGSLRWAIEQANDHTGADTIAFDIPGDGPHTIQPTSALPSIRGPVVIDGYTQPGAEPNTNPIDQGSNAVLKIELDGSQAGEDVDGLRISFLVGSNTIRGLAINRFSGDGIAIYGRGENLIQGNFIGTDVTGTVGLGNAGDGIYLSSSIDNYIGTDSDGVGDAGERNLISGNGGAGCHLRGSPENVIAGNFIGTDVTGTSALPNERGVWLYGHPNNRIGTDGDGVNDLGERNVISGNVGDGVRIQGDYSRNNVVAGNFVGTDVTGTQALGNGGAGVYLGSGTRLNRIGTDGDGVADEDERNVIAANGAQGIYFYHSFESVVAGNFIGTDVTGTAGLGNRGVGIDIYLASESNRVGTNGDGVADEVERNVISGNGSCGIELRSRWGVRATADNVVAGNYIGTDVTGTQALGNAADGLALRSGAVSNTIGTDGDGLADEAERNVISGNHQSGILVEGWGTENNLVAGNFIGTDVTGTAPLGNGSAFSPGNGVAIAEGAQFNLIGTNGDGVADEAERNVISGNAWEGVHIGGQYNVVAGNFIGTDATGAAALGNGSDGVLVADSYNRIGTDGDGIGDEAEGNVIAGNKCDGISISKDHNVVAGNFVGTDRSGTSALPNRMNGIWVQGFTQGNRIGTNGDGVADAAEGNVICGNAMYGVRLSGSFNVVAGNYIGIDVTGATALGNRCHGVRVAGRSNQIGTDGNGVADEAERNVISGNWSAGILIEAGEDNTVAGNFIGTDAAGTTAVPNNASGVWLHLGAQGNRIGSDGDGVADAAEANVISGNTSHGVSIELSESNLVAGNFIGTDLAGVAALPNGGHGVFIWHEARQNTVGGTPGRGNTIAFNQKAGVNVREAGCTGNRIQANAIYSNGGLGIDLSETSLFGDGPTPNDPDDVDTGPNNLQNSPVISLAVVGAATRLVGTLNSMPGTEYTLDFYANTAADPSGFGEGQRWLGQATVTTDEAGDAVFDLLLPSETTIGEMVTATATDPDGNTSELSAAVRVDTPPVGKDDTYVGQENTALTVLGTNGVLGNDTDPDGDPLSAVLFDRPSHGTLTLDPDGSFVYAPEAGFAATDRFTYRASDGELESNLATVTITVEPAPPPEPILFYFSLETDGSVLHPSFVHEGIVSLLYVANEDIVAFDGTYFGLYFDGSDVGLDALAIDALAVVSDSEILMSFSSPGSVPGIAGTVDDSDLIKFTATELSETTAGTFELYFDGSDVGLTRDAENVDAVELLEDGRLLMSTTGYVSVPGAWGHDEDLLAFTPSSLGLDTSGSWARYFDGSDVRLAVEDVSAVATDDRGNLLLSTTEPFSVSGASGADEDVFVFQPTSLGSSTRGSYASTLHFDGSLYGLEDNDVTAVDVAPNHRPLATSEKYGLASGEVLNVQGSDGVLANDSDADGDPLRGILAAAPSHGTVVFGVDGSFTYEPDAGFMGVDQFTYRASDGRLDSIATTVTLVVAEPLGPVDYWEMYDLDPSAGDLWYRWQATRRGYLTLEPIFSGDPDDVQLTLYDRKLGQLRTSSLLDGGSRMDLHVEAGQIGYFKLSGEASGVDLRLANLVSRDDGGVTVHGTDDDNPFTEGRDAFKLWVSAPSYRNDYIVLEGCVVVVHRLVVNGIPYEFPVHRCDDIFVIVFPPGPRPDPPPFSFTFHGGAGSDMISLLASAGDDSLEVWPGHGVLTGEDYTVSIDDVETISISGGGGTDTAKLYDSAGHEEFVATPAYGALHGGGFSNQVRGFRYVHAYSSGGGDVARLADSRTTQDTFVATPDYALLANSKFLNRAVGFQYVHAYSTGGDDVAKLYDDPAAEDTFVATPSYATLSNSHFFSRAVGFGYVHAYSSGGDDVAKLYDDPATQDTFIATPTWSTLSCHHFFNRAVGFRYVHAYSAGGDDAAKLYDDPATEDTFVGTPDYSILTGSHFFNRAVGFDYVHGHSQGGADLAKLYDSPGDDHLEAQGNLAKLSYGRSWIRVLDFARLMAVSSQGGSDTKRVEAIDYLLETIGPWGDGP